MGANTTGRMPKSSSGTLAAANASQSLFTQDVKGNGCAVQNQSSADLYINIFGSPATMDQASIKIAAGQTYVTPPNMNLVAAVSIIGGTLGQAFNAYRW